MFRTLGIFTLYFIYLLQFVDVTAQNDDKFRYEALAEKIYLQTDNIIYSSDETIWFKAILVNAATHKSNNTSNVLHVDLINSKNEVVISKLIKITNGIGNGQLDLITSMEPGTYLLRAHTNWNRNFQSNFNYENYIQVFTAKEKQQVVGRPIQNIKRLVSKQGYGQLMLDLYPEAIDRSHSGELKILIENGNYKDSLSLTEQQGVYKLDYALKNESDYMEITLKTESGNTYSQKIALNNAYCDVQFFPEGGKLINGLPSRVGFKAIGVDGKGKNVQGGVLDGTGEVVTTFKSNDLGMGSFYVPGLEINHNYKVFIEVPGMKTRELDLPKVYPKGTVINVSYNEEKIFVTIKSNKLKDDIVYLEGLCRGYQYFYEQYSLKEGAIELALPKSIFPEGVIALTLFDANKRPILERLLFNERLDRRLKVDLVLADSNIVARDEIKLNFKVTNVNDVPIVANLSVLGVSKQRLNNAHTLRQNILSHLLLSSELKGHIENPVSYFDQSSENDIDYLMLTQGWRNFKYTEQTRSTRFEMKKNLEVTGVVNVKRSKGKKEEVGLTLMAFDKDRTVYNINIEAPSNFKVDLVDTYGDDISVALQAAGKRKISNYIIALNKDQKPQPNFEYSALLLAQDTLIKSLVEIRKELKQKQTDDLNLNGVTQLEEVVLEGYVMTPKRKEIIERHGFPDVVIKGEEIKEKNPSWSYGLISVLESFFRDRIYIETDASGIPKIKSIREVGPKLGAPTLITVDGIVVNKYEYFNIQNIRVDEVTSVEVIDNADRFGRLYKRYDPEAGIVPERGSIVVIYTKNGTGLYGAVQQDKKDYKLKSIQVFSAPKEFYTPKYNLNHRNEVFVPDLRSTIFWKPNLISNKYGVAYQNYYHSDDLGDFVIFVEALGHNGQIGYAELEYEVKENN